MIDFAAVKEQAELGHIDPRIFQDDEVYALELDRVFRRTWLFVAHETMLPKPGDYITQYMGEDPVIVIRDASGRIRVFLNRCRHRGARVCPYDRGSTKFLTCTYHGWAYNLDGSLRDVPELESYGDGLNLADHGLFEVPRVEAYGGFVFANWDAGAISLDAFLGDQKYYIDNTWGRLNWGAGGLEMSPIKQRVISHHNWKIAADNASDMVHFPITHAPASLGSYGIIGQYYPIHDELRGGVVNPVVSLTKGNAGPHTFLAGKVVTDQQDYDMRVAQELGPEAVDYVKQRYAQMKDRDPRWNGYVIVAGLFPTFTVIENGPVTCGLAFELYHPKGPNKTETWIYVAVEKNAPESLKHWGRQFQMRGHSVSGSIMPDDHENWERVQAGSSSPTSRERPLEYILGKDVDASTERFKREGFNSLPGDTQWGLNEAGPRRLYSYWAAMMQEA